MGSVQAGVATAARGDAARDIPREVSHARGVPCEPTARPEGHRSETDHLQDKGAAAAAHRVRTRKGGEREAIQPRRRTDGRLPEALGHKRSGGPGPSPWISQASRAGLRCCVVVVDVFGQLSAAMWQARLVGTPAWRFGPTHVCQGVGCRYCDVSVPGDGRGSRGRTLGRGIRPALNPLLNDGLGETPLAAGRRSGPHGRMRTIPGANDI